MSSTTLEAAVVAAGVDPRSKRYTLPVELGSLSPLVGRAVNAAAARAASRALGRERPTDQDAARTKPRKSDALVRTVFPGPTFRPDAIEGSRSALARTFIAREI